MNGIIAQPIVVSPLELIGEGVYAVFINVQKTLNQLREKIVTFLPAKYGSNLWWEKSDKQSLEDYANGQFVEISSQKELKKILNI